MIGLKIFEKNILQKKNINIEKLICNFDCLENLNTLELQAFLETQPLLFVIINFEEFLKNFNHITEEKKLLRNKIYKKVFQIVDNEKKIFNLNYNTDEVCSQLFVAYLLIIFNNKLLISEKDEGGVVWCNIYDIFENFLAILNRFFIFFNEDGFGLSEREKKNEREFLIQILNICVFQNFLKKKIETSKGGKKGAFYCLNLKNVNSSSRIFLDLKIFFEEPMLVSRENNMFMVGYHYLSVTKVFRENIKSNRFFVLKNLAFLEKIKGIKYFLDGSMYEIIAQKLIQKHGLDLSNPFESVCAKYLASKNLIFLPYFQKKNSEYYNVVIFFYLKKLFFLFEKPFFLAYFFDFRGRLYSDSIISPIGNRIFRFLYHYGNYTTLELSNFEKPLNFSEAGAYDIISSTSLIDKTFLEKAEKNLILKKILIIVFFELGKAIKSYKINEFGGRMSFKDFVLNGVEVFRLYSSNELEAKFPLDFDSQLEILYVLNILKNYNDEKYIKHIIYKDATASAIQLLMVLLESSDVINLRICNLVDDGYWYDTYFFIIENFKKRYPLNLISITHFNRKNLKKTIMTYNYSATFLTCWKEFSVGLKLKEDEFHIVLEDFKEFFKYLKEIFEKDVFFKKSSKSLVNFFKKKLENSGEVEITTSDDSKAYTEYREITLIRLDKKYQNLRFSITFQSLSDNLDLQKIYRSLRPNLVHSLDASYVRLVVDRLPWGIITIHDSFGIDILNVSLLLNIANTAINELHLKEKFYLIRKSEILGSNFILL